MEWNGQQKKVIDKARFYFQEKLKAHVFTIPKGTFKNGLFDSDLIEDKYYWFIEDGSTEKIRLFLSEIYDIEDYHERVEVRE